MGSTAPSLAVIAAAAIADAVGNALGVMLGWSTLGGVTHCKYKIIQKFNSYHD
jgi:hypothetical protein